MIQNDLLLFYIANCPSYIVTLFFGGWRCAVGHHKEGEDVMNLLEGIGFYGSMVMGIMIVAMPAITSFCKKEKKGTITSDYAKETKEEGDS